MRAGQCEFMGCKIGYYRADFYSKSGLCRWGRQHKIQGVCHCILEARFMVDKLHANGDRIRFLTSVIITMEKSNDIEVEQARTRQRILHSKVYRMSNICGRLGIVFV